MQRQATLVELKYRSEEAFAAAQYVIEDAWRIVRDCKRMTAELTHSRDELKNFTRQSRQVTLFRSRA